VCQRPVWQHRLAEYLCFGSDLNWKPYAIANVLDKRVACPIVALSDLVRNHKLSVRVNYWIRMLTERPRWTSPPDLPVALQQILIESGLIEEVGIGTRRECFERYKGFLEGVPLAGLSRFSPPPRPWE
jgi:hypothetical protein